MFKGIIEDIGTIIGIDHSKERDTKVFIKPHNTSFLSKIQLGSSVACSGICLSVVQLHNEYFSADISQATLSVTNTTYWEKGTKINLELPLKMNDRLDGHFVQGHVDSTGVITTITHINSSHNIIFQIQEPLLKYIIIKGSISINGVSLTVNTIVDNTFSVNIIPYTWNNTIFQYSKVNDIVNIEVDMIAKHIEKLYQYNSIL
ncbi:riboflavin synthase [Ehrlichia ruminantium]|uniref:Riboflavin synthase n=1 Tax=Ehrlichia ruminantium TaxID=779 RepID=A0AAE6UIS5_EHRRU|nr:riboflavin synthase [Ehrlichia ruminantium]QGR02806.1 riboflavin synthase [Ehrlichia ruminantium]QGR03730.1 riboflavin synthase [Ehrlichia ruminantium]QGR04657.1 riboflavin synthase [Ehrlichia ruminantium]